MVVDNATSIRDHATTSKDHATVSGGLALILIAYATICKHRLVTLLHSSRTIKNIFKTTKNPKIIGKERIPRGIALFNAYINTTDNFLQAPIEEGSSTLNWQRLGLTAADATGWHGQQVEWNKLYAKYSNLDTRTKTVNDLVKAFKTNFQDFGGRILDKIASSDGATEQDQNVFNLVLSGNRKKPTHHTTPITDTIVVSIVSLGSGMIKADFRTDTDTKRASLAPGSDSVQIAIKIGDPAPESPEDNMELHIITRASYKVNMGVKTVGKRVYFYARWYNTRQPELAGQWSTLFSILIGQ